MTTLAAYNIKKQNVEEDFRHVTAAEVQKGGSLERAARRARSDAERDGEKADNPHQDS